MKCEFLLTPNSQGKKNYHNLQQCRNLIGQFAVIDKSTDNAACVSVSRNAFIRP